MSNDNAITNRPNWIPMGHFDPRLHPHTCDLWVKDSAGSRRIANANLRDGTWRHELGYPIVGEITHFVPVPTGPTGDELHGIPTADEQLSGMHLQGFLVLNASGKTKFAARWDKGLMVFDSPQEVETWSRHVAALFSALAHRVDETSRIDFTKDKPHVQ